MRHHRLHFHNFPKPAPNKCDNVVAWWIIVIESIGIVSVVLLKIRSHVRLHLIKRRISIGLVKGKDLYGLPAKTIDGN